MQTAARLVVVLPRGNPAPYRKVIDRVRERGKLFRLVYGLSEFPWGGRQVPVGPGRSLKHEWMKEADWISAANLKDSSVLVLGRDNSVLARIFGKQPADPRLAGPSEGFLLDVRKNPYNPERLVAVLDSASPEDTAAGLELVEDMAGYSGLRVVRGKVAEKWTTQGVRGIVVELDTPESRSEEQSDALTEHVP